MSPSVDDANVEEEELRGLTARKIRHSMAISHVPREARDGSSVKALHGNQFGRRGHDLITYRCCAVC